MKRSILALVMSLGLFGSGGAAPKTVNELAQELEQAVPTGRTTTVPTPLGVPSPATMPSGSGMKSLSTGVEGQSGNRALRNLREEEADRTQRRILEQLR